MTMAAAAASNKFATMLHNRNTPKIVIVLIYTLLEWILIALLLLDGLFSYFIAAFAAFFGLDPPCFLCSHALGRNSGSSYREILCDSHADEIAGLGYCSRHRNLARVSHMCEDCSSSKPLASWMNEEEEKERTCSCCSEVLETGFYSPSPLIFGKKFQERFVLDEETQGSLLLNGKSHERSSLDEKNDVRSMNAAVEDASVELPITQTTPQLELEDRLVPVELVDSSTLVDKDEESSEIDDSIVVVPASREEEEEEEECGVVMDVEAACAISIGREICDQEEALNMSAEAYAGTMAKEPSDDTLARVGHPSLSVCPELTVAEVEEESVPETPTSVDSFHALPERFMFERKELGTESLDGSVASTEIDGNEILTVHQLKEALKAERKALSSLYLELEEERSASAIAANQTMAMITRLQEEKAAVLMEAVQYQRMMEEQSEYDQEALQLLNELMMKREKELEVYRKKVLDCEAKERMSTAAGTNRRSQTSSGSSSADESNDLSSEDCDYSHNDDLSFGTDQGAAAKHLHTLEDSLADFEEERFSILEQLKALEEKLFSFDDNDDSNATNGAGHDHFPEQNGHGLNEAYDESSADDVNVSGSVNGTETNGKLIHHDRAVVSVEREDGSSPDSLTKSTLHNHKQQLAIAEEVDHVYERLHALEADREFIKHCVDSVKKGDKGMDLLQEVLQHLRALRSVQLRVRNAAAGYALSSSSSA